MKNPEKSYVADILYLKSLIEPTRKSNVYYDETDDTTITFENGSVEISTDFIDYTSYRISFDGDSLHVTATRLDDPNRHEKAKVIEFEMDEDDEADMAERIGRMAAETRKYQKVQNTDVTSIWKSLMKELFPRMNYDESNLPKFEKSKPSESLTDVLTEANLIASFEWKEWAEIGTREVNGFLILQKHEIEIAMPTEKQQDVVRRSRDFGQSVLNWFHSQMSPFEMTLMALSPMDEYQNFVLLSTTNVKKVQDLLHQLAINGEFAAAYKKKN